jgi:hypothetical protein
MAKVEIAIPESLGLTATQLKDLRERFTNQLVDVLDGSHTVEVAKAKEKAKYKRKVQWEIGRQKAK